ncbi:MAG: metallophosphoesterase [Thermoplasmata archaeon]|nr:metallophosphoesterase [Thermoplasmata archaeon]
MPGREPLSPPEILALSSEEADALLDRLEREVPVSPPLAELPARPFSEAIVFGDTHGDWRSSERVVAEFRGAAEDHILLGLGDYVDRAPDDCEQGSVANALYLLGLVAKYPDRVVLVKGNHELDRWVGVLPHDLPEEVDLLWGPDENRYQRIASLLERGPYAAVSPSGVYFAHGGFPRVERVTEWKSLFGVSDEDLTLDVGWGECGASRARHGAVTPFTEVELVRFLQQSGTRLFLRGHDPDLTGRWVFGDRCLTLHTSRTYERYGGVLYARVPLDRAVDSSGAVRIERLLPAPAKPRSG